jgi:hypothetical protein
MWALREPAMASAHRARLEHLACQRASGRAASYLCLNGAVSRPSLACLLVPIVTIDARRFMIAVRQAQVGADESGSVVSDPG